MQVDAAEGTPIPAKGLRERQRLERQRRVVRAARILLSEERDSGAGFSMLELAQAAGFSPTTPYNLLGSKAEVLRKVFAQEIEGFHRTVAREASGDPVVAILHLAEDLASEFCKRPTFYQALARSLRDLGSDDSRLMLLPLGKTLFAPLIEKLDGQGALQDWIPRPTLIAQLNHSLDAIFSYWIRFEWSPERLLAELQVGLSLALLGGLLPAHQEPLGRAVKPIARKLAALATQQDGPPNRGEA